MPCHSSGKSVSASCAHSTDLAVADTPALPPVDAAGPVIALMAGETIDRAESVIADPSPPWSGLPLRI